MNISEILRGLVDLIDGQQADDQEIELTNTEVTPSGDEDAGEETQGIMIPPLQQKIELLKKAVDVPNVYGDEECGCESPSPEDEELSRIKKIAGVPTAAVMMMSDDEPLDN